MVVKQILYNKVSNAKANCCKAEWFAHVAVEKSWAVSLYVLYLCTVALSVPLIQNITKSTDLLSFAACFNNYL